MLPAAVRTVPGMAIGQSPVAAWVPFASASNSASTSVRTCRIRSCGCSENTERRSQRQKCSRWSLHGCRRLQRHQELQRHVSYRSGQLDTVPLRAPRVGPQLPCAASWGCTEPGPKRAQIGIFFVPFSEMAECFPKKTSPWRSENYFGWKVHKSFENLPN